MQSPIQVACPSCLVLNRLDPARTAQAPACGRCGAPLLPPAPLALTEDSFDRYVKASGLPVVVDFWAAWCGPCRAMAPQFEAAAAERPLVRFAKVDTDAAPQLAQRLAIRSIPTLVLFRGGREVARRSGALSREQLLAWIDPFAIDLQGAA